MSMADELVADIRRAVDYLDHHYIFNETQVSNGRRSFLKTFPAACWDYQLAPGSCKEND